jgi:hypothetical protein
MNNVVEYIMLFYKFLFEKGRKEEGEEGREEERKRVTKEKRKHEG